MAILPPVFKQRYFSASGLPLAGGKIYTYIAGTTTLQTTYTDATEASANTNPIILDADGECDLWLGSSSYKIKLTDSADVEQWTVDFVNQSSIQSLASADYIENLGITCSTSSNALTVNIKTASGGVPGVGSPVRAGFRSSSLASGLVSLVEIISPLSMTISSGSTLGHSSGVNSYIYVYALNYNGTAEIAVSTTFYAESSVVTTTAEGGAGAADSGSLIYSITARTNVPIRLVARLTSNQTTAGTWASVPTEIQTGNEARRGAVSFASTALSYANATTSYTTAGSITFTTTGRDCEWGIYQQDTTIGSLLVTSTGAVSNITANVKLVNSTSAADLSINLMGSQIITAVSGYTFYGHTGSWGFFKLAAGTYTFNLDLRGGGASLSVQANNLKFYIREL
jgi:hypothetical protein